MTSDRATEARRLAAAKALQAQINAGECSVDDLLEFAADAEARGRAEGALKPERITIETATMRVEQRPIPPDIQRDIEAAIRQGRLESAARLSPEEPPLRSHAVRECTEAHLVLDRLGAPTVKRLRRLRTEGEQPVTMGLSERITAVSRPRGETIPETIQMLSPEDQAIVEGITKRLFSQHDDRERLLSIITRLTGGTDPEP